MLFQYRFGFESIGITRHGGLVTRHTITDIRHCIAWISTSFFLPLVIGHALSHVGGSMEKV